MILRGGTMNSNDSQAADEWWWGMNDTADASALSELTQCSIDFWHMNLQFDGVFVSHC